MGLAPMAWPTALAAPDLLIRAAIQPYDLVSPEGIFMAALQTVCRKFE